jgi:septation ring formation regulator EzrA
MERAQILESIKEMDAKELAEELPKLREEALKAEEALRVAQERLHEADHKLAKIPTFVEVHDDHLVVDRRGWDKMVKLLGRLTIPLDHVVRAEADPN